MTIAAKLDQLHFEVRSNKWLSYFTIFCRVSLAIGFIFAGIVKIQGERFASGLSAKHPMGHYLEALYHTAYYYPFIGVLQVLAAVLLLIPRTATLGAVIYFPIILNILILSWAVRFDGSLVSSPLMTLANLYLLCWDYDKLKRILPWYRPTSVEVIKPVNHKFPWGFFTGVVLTIPALILILDNTYDIMPHNTMKICKRHCGNSKNPDACNVFCECIHEKGLPIEQALDEYHKALKSSAAKHQ